MKVPGSKSKKLINILLDTGSSVNLITENAAERLQLKLEPPRQLKISTVNGMCNGKSSKTELKFVPRNGRRPFTLTVSTHKDLGKIPDCELPIIPSFYDPHAAVRHYDALNGFFPRESLNLDVIVSQHDLPRFLWEGMRVYSIHHPNRWGISNLPEDGSCYALYDTHWGDVWAGGSKYSFQCAPLVHARSVSHQQEESEDEKKESEDSGCEVEDVYANYTTEDLNVTFKRLMELDRLPMMKEDSAYTNEEVMAINKVNQVMHLDPVNKRMRTKLLLKEDVNLQNNYWAVKSRMDQLFKSFKTNPVKNAVKKQELVKQWKMFSEEMNSVVKYDDPYPWLNDTGIKNYMPMVVVVKETSLTTPFRACVEGNCKTGTGLSINDNILVTPSLHIKIADIEARSRLGKFLLIADIKKLFLHMFLDDEDDRLLVRVLWKDPDGPEDAPWEVYSFNCCIYGLADAPFQLNTALNKCVNYWKEMVERSDLELRVADKFIRSLYVDDLTMVFNEIEEAKKAVKICSDIVSVGGFKFRKWISNSSEVLASIPEKDRAPHSTIIEHDRGQEMEKYVSDPALQLGYRYNGATDEFVMDRFGGIAESRDTSTKRGVASCLASVYDPLKLVGCFTLAAKRVMKETHRYKLDWKDKISKLLTHPEVIAEGRVEYIQNILDLWASWLKDLKNLDRVTFPRYIPNNRESKYIIASDASTIGVAATVHIVTTENGITTSHLLSSLCNITPLKTNMEQPLSVPLLELKAMGLAVDLGIWCQEELDVSHDQLIFISDSRVSIAWSLKSPEKLQNHIAIVVKRIQNAGFVFHYVKTDQNQAADLASRSGTVADIEGDVWKHGPAWYKLPVEEHPYNFLQSTKEKYNIPEIGLGLKKKYCILESENKVKIDDQSKEVASKFTKPANTVFKQHFFATPFICKNMLEQYGQQKGTTMKSHVLQRPSSTIHTSIASQTTAQQGTAGSSGQKSSKPGPYARSILRALRAGEEDLQDKGVTLSLPRLSYLGVTTWAYKQLELNAALVFYAVDKFKEKNVLGKRKAMHATLSHTTMAKHCKDNFPAITESHKKRAQLYYIILSQWQHYYEEMITLHRTGADGKLPQVKQRSPLAGYAPHLRVAFGTLQVMCATGRLDGDPALPIEVRHPPILPKKSKFAVLLILHVHTATFPHAGPLQTYNHVKRMVLIVAGLQLTKKVLRLCVTCRRLTAKRHQQLMGNLPRPFLTGEGTTTPLPFQFCSLDYTGSITLYPMGAGNTRPLKCYLAVFYCLFTKAFFVTAVTNESTSNLLMAYEKLACTFHRPEYLTSDRQASFVKGATVIRERLSHINENLVSMLENNTFQWDFSPSYTPSSVWEKPIDMAKRAMYKVFRSSGPSATTKLNYEQMDLVCRRIMFTLNERPLEAAKQSSMHYIGTNDVGYITPHRLIFGHDLAPIVFEWSKTKISFNSEQQLQQLKNVEVSVRHFNNHYQKIYITEAKNRAQWRRKKDCIDVGDLVLVESKGTRKFEKRSSWSAGRILTVYKGRDDLIRRADVLHADGRLRLHPLHDLFPLLDYSTTQLAEALNELN